MPRRKKSKEELLAEGTYRSDRTSLFAYKNMEGMPTPPPHFNERQQELWYNYAAELLDKKILMRVSIEILQKYVFAVSVTEACEVILDTMTPLDKEYRNVSITWKENSTLMLQIAAKFGFTPADKGRIFIEDANAKKSEDAFTKFLELKEESK